MTINFDLPHNITIFDFFKILSEFDLTLVSHNTDNPNPNITLTSSSNINILKFAQKYQLQNYSLKY